MMVANIPYAYTIEIGPLEKETHDNHKFRFGFHVTTSEINYVVERAYTGLREYMRTFMDKLSKEVQTEIDKKCSEDYNELMKSFSGYWS